MKIRVVGSMGISISWASGFRLQASGFRLQASGFRLQASGFRLQASGIVLALLVQRLRPRARVSDDPVSSQSLGDALHRVTRVDLGLAPLIDVPADAPTLVSSRRIARGSQLMETDPVDRLERQCALKSRFGSRLELGGGTKSAISLDLRAIAAEAQRSRTLVRRGPSASRYGLSQLFFTARAQRTRSRSLELTAW